MTRRRTLLGIAAILVLPVVGGAQPAGKVYRIGILETLPAAQNGPNLAAFVDGLKTFGYVEGRNLVLEYRSADGRPERFAGLAAELTAARVDLILTRGTPAALAAKAATTSIPIVMAASGDPLASRIVTSLARPGGNITGLSSVVADLGGKRIGLLKEAVPAAVKIGVLANMSNPAIATEWREMQPAARLLGLQTHLLDVRAAAELEGAFATATRQHVDALAVTLDALTQAERRRIVELSARHRLPGIHAERSFVDLGGLMAYGVSYPHLYRRAALFVDRIFRGSRAGDLPVEQPTNFEFVVNLKTAKALGLILPASLLVRADHTIE